MTISTDAKRLAAALGVAGVSQADEDAETIQRRIDRRGIQRAVADLNETYEVLLQVGPYIVRSEKEFGYWSNDFGFVYDCDSATGYPASVLQDSELLKRIRILAPDALFVPYEGAVDFEETEAPELEAFEQ